MTEFVFVRPWWLAAVPVGLALVWWLRRHWDRRGSWESIVDPACCPTSSSGLDRRGANGRGR